MYQQSLAILRRQIDHLTRLIDDMLDLARLTAGKIRLRTETWISSRRRAMPRKRPTP